MVARLTVFDPAMCLSTGTCGVNVDPDLERFDADLRHIEEQCVVVERYKVFRRRVRSAGAMTRGRCIESTSRLRPAAVARLARAAAAHPAPREGTFTRSGDTNAKRVFSAGDLRPPAPSRKTLWKAKHAVWRQARQD